jgi:hypothetical protein
MVEIRYGDVIPQPGAVNITGIGMQPGPVGGDGWQIAHRLPQDRLPAGTGRYAIIVTGKIGHVHRSGAVPQRGVIQVCLGHDTGAISPIHKVNIPVGEQLGETEGIPFMFVVLMNSSPSISDPFFGNTFNNSSGARFCLWARTYWNGDSPQYAVSFDIADVGWLWWDTDRIPSTDQLTEHYHPAVPVSLTTTLAGVFVTSNSPGLVNQKWLHFMALTYEPRQHLANAPRFDFGWSPTPGSFTGYTATVGTNGRWGQMRALPTAGATEEATLSQGCFWYQQRPTGVFLPGLRGADRQSGTATRVRRVCYVGVRLDNLLDVLQRTETEVVNATCNLNGYPSWPDVYVPLERPATGTVSLPCVLTHGIVQTTGRQSYDAGINTNLGTVLDFVEMCAQSDAAKQEGVSAMAFSPLGLSPTEPDIQYRALWIGFHNAPPLPLNVRDITIVSFYMVRDPEVLPNVPPAVGPPLVLSPGRESANPASLLQLPIKPDGSMPEDSAREEARIDGATGYSRTWPLFAKVRRTFTLSWSRLSESQATTLYGFLRDNPAFALRPHRAAADIAVVQLDAPLRQQVSAHVFSMVVRCVELIWTN